MKGSDQHGPGDSPPAPFPTELWEAADLITPMAIRVAATLGVADHIDAGISEASRLAEATDTNPDALRRLLAHLATAGFIRESDDGEWHLTQFGEQLTSEHPSMGRAWLDKDGALGRGDLAVFGLEETIRTGQPSYPRVYGRGFWEDLAADPDLSASFDRLMSGHGFDHVLVAYDWSTANHVVDVGGGDGTLLAAILTAHPDLQGTVVELAAPAAAAREKLAAAGLADRARVVEGSFFDPLPDQGDHYVLSGIVHGWDDAEATRVLRRCAEAAGPSGRVILVEGLQESGEEISTEMDLRMLTYVGGRERDYQQLSDLVEAAGLTIDRVTPANEYSSIVVLTSPTG